MKKTLSLSILERMILIRETEIFLSQRYSENSMRCPMHLCLGQEALPAVLGSLVEKDDIFFGNYRSHGHYLSKGGDLFAFFAELLGRKEGCSKGMGGSMHLIDLEAGFYGASAIVAATVPIAAGLALSLKLKKDSRIVVVFFGDGAMEEGIVFEAANFAMLHRLPILFACENNRLAITTPLELRTCAKKLTSHFACFDMPGLFLEGSNPLQMADKLLPVCEQVRNGNGPFFIEVLVSRWATHVGPFFKGPVDLWWQDPKSEEAKPCPIARLVCDLVEKNRMPFSQIKTLREEIKNKIQQTFEKSLQVPPPSEESILENVYASGLVSKLPTPLRKVVVEPGKAAAAPSMLENPF